MIVLFGILIIVASVILGVIVLIQNPKGGGLSGSLSGFSNQLMGVKQTNDVMEKGTWIFAAVVGILCIISPAFIPKDGGSTSTKNDDLLKDAKTAPAPQPIVPKNTGTMPVNPAPVSPSPTPKP
jgi:preprotein translocase subunit SecG